MDLDEDGLIKKAKKLLRDDQIGIASEIHYQVQNFTDEEGNIYEMTISLTAQKIIPLSEMPEEFKALNGFTGEDDSDNYDDYDDNGDADEEDADLS